MSQVFMCDSCGELFSANAKGWREFKEEWDGSAKSREVFHNPHNHGAMLRHVGPCCAFTGETVKPRLALPGGDK